MKKRIAVLMILAMLLCCGCQENGAQDTTAETLPTEAHVHTDAGDDGTCDGCGQWLIVSFDLYAINDLHGKIVDGSNHPGVDELTTYLKLAQEKDDHAIILSAGDMWQGASESNMTKGILVTDWMNELDFAAMTIGNHEFDWGEEYIEANAEFAQFPLLAINIYDRETDARVDYCQASVVVECDGFQVGIIGAIGDCYSSISADKVEDVYFVTGTALTELVMEESQRLMEEGVDFIVYSLHDGSGRSEGTAINTVSGSAISSYYDTALSDGYVDLVFEGHTHQQYLLRDEYGVYHLQNRGENRGGISHVEVWINQVTGSYTVSSVELVTTGSYSDLADDPIVEALLEKYADEIAPANEIVGTNSTYRSSDHLRQLVADLYYQLGDAVWGEEYDITLGGGFISVRSPYDLPAGEVTYSQLQSLFPFDNDIVLCSVKGRDLLKKFINTSNSNYFISGEDVSADSIDPNGTYYVVVDTYTSSYAYNNLTVVEEYENGVYARDLLADYIGYGGLD